MFGVFNSLLRLLNLNPRADRSEAVLPIWIHANSTTWRNDGWFERKVRNLNGFVPAKGRGQEKFMRQGEWSENSWGRKEPMLLEKISIHLSLTIVWSSFLMIGAVGFLLVQIWLQSWYLRSMAHRCKRWSLMSNISEGVITVMNNLIEVPTDQSTSIFQGRECSEPHQWKLRKLLEGIDLLTCL